MNASAPRRIYLDLSIVRTKDNGLGIKIPEQFKQLLLLDSNDNDNQCEIVVGREFSGNNAVKYSARDGIEVAGDSAFIEGATIYNSTAQSGKYMWAEIHFETKRSLGSISVAGEFDVINPSSGDDLPLLGVAAANTVYSLITADSTRRNLGIYNNLAQGVWIKFENNNALTGRFLPSGGYMETKNRGQLYYVGTAIEAAVVGTGVGIHLTPEF